MSRRRHVLVTGATGQLGTALVNRLADASSRLSLCALEQDALETHAAQSEGRHDARPAVAAIDVRDGQRLAAWVCECHATEPLDWVIMNAGMGGQIAAGTLIEDPERTMALIGANLIGVVNTLHAALPLLRQQGHGRLIVISSLSALIGYDKAPVYAATKAALRVLALSLRPALAAEGIGLTIVCPGFLDQPMQAGHAGWRPFSISAEAAAHRIVVAAEKGKAEIHFPHAMAALVQALALMPIAFRESTYRRLAGAS
jgi:short-subunit dehydrogenase